MEYLTERVNAHLTDYTSVARTCVRKLAQAYSDLGMNEEEQLAAFDKVVVAAEAAWTDACESVDVERQALRDRVDKDLSEILKIKESLGDEDADVELAQCQEEASSPRVTLRSLQERVLRRLEHWKARRMERMAEYEAVVAITSTLKSQLGQAQQNTRPDLSHANIDFLRMEQDKLRAEKDKRIKRLESLLSTLHEQCAEVGESGKLATQEVHHSLWHFRESREVVASAMDTSDQSLGSAVKQAASRQEELLATVDLGDAMFERLQAKMQDVAALKAEREAQLQELSSVLDSLWTALRISPETAERKAVSALFYGPTRLYGSSIEACTMEVSRLEQQQNQAMKDLVVSKALELEALCESSLMSPPDVSALLLEMSQQSRRDATGQVSDVLAKMMRLIVEVQAEAHKRAGLVAMVSELTQAQAELAWLHKYEHDENRFKGRDAHSNLQRSLRAAKMRERVPPLIRSIQQAAQGWRLREGTPFLVHGDDYAEVVLPEVARLVEQGLADKAGSTAAKQAKGAAASAAGSVGSKTSTAASRPTHVPQGPTGPSARAHQQQVQQHALSHQGLVERRSMTVPMPAAAGPSSRDRDRDHSGPSKLSRSTDFRAQNLAGAEGASIGSIGGGGGVSRRATATGAPASKPSPAPVGGPAALSRSMTSPSQPHKQQQQQPQERLQLTPMRPDSSVGRAAAAQGGTPGRDPMQEKMRAIISTPPPSAVVAGSGGSLSSRPASRYTTPVRFEAVQAAPAAQSLAVQKHAVLAKALAADPAVGEDAPRSDTQSPREQDKPRGVAAAAAPAVKGAGAAGAGTLEAGRGAAAAAPAVKGVGAAVAGVVEAGRGAAATAAVLPSPAKPSKIPRFFA